MIAYGTVQCTTNAFTIASASAITVKVGSTSYTCANSDTTQCQYTTGSSMPSVSAASIVSNYISLTGTNFITSSGFTPKARFAGVYADSVTINSATDAVATFNNGVPYQGSTSPVKPELYFVSTTTTETHWASVTPTLSNQPPNLATSSVTCSYAGGCALSIAAQGLSSSLSNSTKS